MPVPVETTVWRFREKNYETPDAAIEAASLAELDDWMKEVRADGYIEWARGELRNLLIKHADQLSRILDRVASNRQATP